MTAAEPRLDYFQIYDVGTKVAAGTVWLRRACDTRRVRMHLPVLDHFGAPVSMDAEAPGDPGAHVAWYSGVQPPEPMRAVTTDWKLA